MDATSDTLNALQYLFQYSSPCEDATGKLVDTMFFEFQYSSTYMDATAIGIYKSPYPMHAFYHINVHFSIRIHLETSPYLSK